MATWLVDDGASDVQFEQFGVIALQDVLSWAFDPTDWSLPAQIELTKDSSPQLAVVLHFISQPDPALGANTPTGVRYLAG